MSLALRLLLSFGLLALVATGVVGFGAREAWHQAEEQRFEEQLKAAKEGVVKELGWETAQIRDLLKPKCEHDAYIDQTLIELERRELDAGRRLAISQLVGEEMKALHMDELLLFTGTGEILGAGHDPAATGKIDRTLAGDLSPRDQNLVYRPAGLKTRAALVTRCSKKLGSQTVGLMGARYLDSTLNRIGEAYGVKLSLAPKGALPANPAEASLVVDVPSPELSGLRLVASISKRTLEENLALVDERIVVASAITVGFAIIGAILLARTLSRPLVALARQAGEVVDGELRPVEPQGGRELEAFARAFNKALEDLVKLRKRLATTERIAARREIARQVAHEIKNPLAPIRAAVETLRRLRARQDPAFDDYFDEATRTVLDEVFRITKIVSEFTEFARLPAPHPAPVKLEEIAKSTVALYATGGAQVSLDASECPIINADRDQVAQILTNLIQNGLDAAEAGGKIPEVRVRVRALDPARVSLSVSDNGPGVSDEMLPRLFEPYATNKPTGTGLGLAIVQRIVQEHGGEIGYERSASGGAVFRIILPVAGPGSPQLSLDAPEDSQPLPRG
ncbi:MAG TPA: ATP-binding protein [Polyangiaceae bacterium]|nr:ATP-binding protein [Polyangiaceae bacterium]